MRLKLRLDQANDLLRSGDLLDLLRKPVHSESTGIGLRKDLPAGPEPRLAKIEREIRPATRDDLRALVDVAGADPTQPQDAADRRRQGRIVATFGTHGCFVADGEDGLPGFMHYLFTSEDNELFQSKYSHTGPVLADDEAMVEFLYVTPAARTMSFVTDCMTLMTEEARKRGARSVVTFPESVNRGALMVSHFVGFRPYAVRRSRYRLFRKTTTYELRPPETRARSVGAG